MYVHLRRPRRSNERWQSEISKIHTAGTAPEGRTTSLDYSSRVGAAGVLFILRSIVFAVFKCWILFTSITGPIRYTKHFTAGVCAEIRCIRGTAVRMIDYFVIT